MQHDKAERSLSKRTLLKKVREFGLLGLGVLVKIGRVVIILVLVLLSYPVLEFMIEYGRTHSEAYQVARQFAVTNSDVLQVTGPVSTVRIDNRFNFHFCGEQADYTLDLTGERADVILQIQVKYLADSWVVTEAALRMASHTARFIRQTTRDWSVDADAAGLYPFLWRNACYVTSFPPMLSGTSGWMTGPNTFSRHTEVSSLGVEIGERRRSLSVEESTNTSVATEGKGYATMSKKISAETIESSPVCYATLEQWARGKIQAQLQQLLEEEVTTFLGRVPYARRGMVSPVDPPTGSRNGYGPPRAFSMMSGTVTVRRPRVRDLTERFESKVLPLFKRRTQEVGTLLPELYLHGLSTGDFALALRGLLGEGAPLSASSIQRLKARFELDYEAWKKRDLSGLEVVYWWADGLYVKAGIEDRKSALLTIVGALTTGDKVVLACESGERESKESWLKLLRDLKHRGLTFPRLTVADGHLGIWAALGEIHPTGEEQRCWNHKITNVLDDLPKRVQQKAAEWLKAMPYAETKDECERQRDEFVRTYRRTEGKAVATLLRDWDRMVTFYSFPHEHWRHLRTTNIVESPFASVRLRTDASRRYKRVEGATAIIWKMLRVAEQSWRKLNAPELLSLVASGTTFKDGIKLKSEHERNNRTHQPERTAA